MSAIVWPYRRFPRILLILTAYLIFSILPGVFQTQVFSSEASFPEIQLASDDRILILAPHPNDEVLGCAGIIQKALARQLPVKVVFFTYGDNNEWSFLLYRKHPVIFSNAVRNMGLIRHNEALQADKTLGLLPEQLVFFGLSGFWDVEYLV